MGSARPGIIVAGYQSWRRLTFIHWRVPVESIQRLLPNPLRVDSFDGSAWIGLVPFSMERIRPWWSPSVPGISWFLETNVRTYVRHPDGTTGVWFFSLEANSWLAVTIARRIWNLPYYRAVLSLSSSRRDAAERINCQGIRRVDAQIGYRLTTEVPVSRSPAEAVPGSLEHFLVERYTLFAVDHQGSLFSGQVHHDPYQICPASVEIQLNSLVDASGCCIEHPETPDHVAWSDGVDVVVSPLVRLSTH